jgi:hypothetical protein
LVIHLLLQWSVKDRKLSLLRKVANRANGAIQGWLAGTANAIFALAVSKEQYVDVKF